LCSRFARFSGPPYGPAVTSPPLDRRLPLPSGDQELVFLFHIPPVPCPAMFLCVSFLAREEPPSFFNSGFFLYISFSFRPFCDLVNQSPRPISRRPCPSLPAVSRPKIVLCEFLFDLPCFFPFFSRGNQSVTVKVVLDLYVGSKPLSIRPFGGHSRKSSTHNKLVRCSFTRPYSSVPFRNIPNDSRPTFLIPTRILGHREVRPAV